VAMPAMSIPLALLIVLLAFVSAELARMAALVTLVPIWLVIGVWLLVLWPGKGAFR